MIFTQMQQETSQLLKSIKQLPFNLELARGTLPNDIFIFYLQQDMLYLTEFARALALTAVRSPNNQLIQQYLHFATGAISAEKSLHAEYLKKYPTSTSVHPTPACFAYTNYLLRMAALENVEESAAALLPCFWIYQEVGQEMLLKTNKDNPYIDWISLYAGQEFKDSVTRAIDAVNFLGNAASPATQNKMITAFKTSSKLEYYFWQDSYTLHEKLTNSVESTI